MKVGTTEQGFSERMEMDLWRVLWVVPEGAWAAGWLGRDIFGGSCGSEPAAGLSCSLRGLRIRAGYG
jgi:hypothetical protein